MGPWGYQYVREPTYEGLQILIAMIITIVRSRKVILTILGLEAALYRAPCMDCADQMPYSLQEEIVWLLGFRAFV